MFVLHLSYSLFLKTTILFHNRSYLLVLTNKKSPLKRTYALSATYTNLVGLFSTRNIYLKQNLNCSRIFKSSLRNRNIIFHYNIVLRVTLKLCNLDKHCSFVAFRSAGKWLIVHTYWKQYPLFMLIIPLRYFHLMRNAFIGVLSVVCKFCCSWTLSSTPRPEQHPIK